MKTNPTKQKAFSEELGAVLFAGDARKIQTAHIISVKALKPTKTLKQRVKITLEGHKKALTLQYDYDIDCEATQAVTVLQCAGITPFAYIRIPGGRKIVVSTEFTSILFNLFKA